MARLQGQRNRFDLGNVWEYDHSGGCERRERK